MNLYAPRRIITIGAIAPSARYSPIASSRPSRPARRKTARARDNEWDAARAFEEAHLVPEPALAQHLAVVAREDHDRVLGEPGRGKRRHEPPELVVDVRDRPEIGAPRVADLLFGHRPGVHRAHMTQA